MSSKENLPHPKDETPFKELLEKSLKGIEHLDKDLDKRRIFKRSSKEKTEKRFAAPSPPQLDLHRHTLADAYKRTDAFIQKCLARKDSAAIIVTGKGLHSQREPVLKKEIYDFLKNHSAVTGVSQAPYHQGGEGAWKVFMDIR